MQEKNAFFLTMFRYVSKKCSKLQKNAQNSCMIQKNVVILCPICKLKMTN